MHSRSSTRTKGRNGTLGFFVMGYCFIPLEGRVTQYPYPRFLYISEKGKGLKEGKWGNFDESLSFIGNQHPEGIYILSSSNGFLLCCSNVKGSNDYMVCNPVTAEFRNLPTPQRAYLHSAIAFNCKAGNVNDDATSSISLDEVHFEVIRAGMSNARKFTTTLELDTYSSVTNTWTETSLVSNAPFKLCTVHEPGFVIGQVVYFKETFGSLLAYDRANQRVVLVKPPGDRRQGCSKVASFFQKKEKFVCFGRLYGQCEGKVQCVRHDYKHLEIWVLKDYYRRSGSAKWVIKHRVSFDVITSYNPEICTEPNPPFSIESLDPHNSGLVLLTTFEKPYLFNIATMKLTEVCGFTQGEDSHRIQYCSL